MDMKFEETSPGSFIAQGIGLRYEYCASTNALDVSRSITPDAERPEALANLHFDTSLSNHPSDYVAVLEKASQISALMYSNNQTIDITETLQGARLAPILKNAAILSRYAHDIKTLRLERFSDFFAREFDLKAIKLKQFTSGDGTRTFFVGRMQTKFDNSICVRACTLAGMMAALSDRTVRDLITMEFGHRFENSAQRLLQVSSKLSTISHILDDGFIPARKIHNPDIHSKRKTQH